MKKDLIFTPAMLLISILLFLYRATGLATHITFALIGVLVLAVYTAATKKEWKTPALEVLMRFFYGISLISGIVVNITEIVAVAIVHKASSALFVILLVVLFIKKLIANKK